MRHNKKPLVSIAVIAIALIGLAGCGIGGPRTVEISKAKYVFFVPISGPVGYIDQNGRPIQDFTTSRRMPLQTDIPMNYDEPNPVNPVWAPIAFQTAHMSHRQWETMRAAVEKADYENARPFTQGLAAVSWNQKWGYIDTTGKLVIPLRYDGAWPFHEGLAIVLVGQSVGYINTLGRYVVPPEYHLATMAFHEGRAGVGKERSDVSYQAAWWGYINTSGKLVIPMQYETVSDFNDGYAYVDPYKGGGGAFIDKSGKQVFPQYWARGGFSEGLAPAMAPVPRDELPPENGIGFINLGGQLVIPYRYHAVGPFSDGLAAVRYAKVIHNATGDHEELGPWGFIDKKGQMVIKAQFNNPDPGPAAVPQFNHGLAWMKTYLTAKGPTRSASEIGGHEVSETPGKVIGEIDGYINEKGKWVWKHTTMYKREGQQGTKAN